MYLVHARLCGIAPFGDIDVSFLNAEGEPRMVTVVHGGAGVGKTSLLTAIANTRPGHAVTSASMRPSGDAKAPPHAWCDWLLSDDDIERPHPLRVASPHAVTDPRDEAAALRRREQALFDRRARAGGFVCLAFPSARWFSRHPVTLNAPLRSIARYDARTTTPLDDANRFDLTRETKQALAYAAVASALSPKTHRERVQAKRRSPVWRDTRLLGTAMHETTNEFVGIAGFRYDGLDAVSLEPLFSSKEGNSVPFDGLPTRVRHLAAFAALTIRAVWAAYPHNDPRTAQAVVMIDDAELRQDAEVVAKLIPMLRRCLPRAQWILSSTSGELAAVCNAGEVLALRRLSDSGRVELFSGAQAQTH
ncbi:MAG: hypothetical protein AAF721_20275 [Myxococcota bacterium]